MPVTQEEIHRIRNDADCLWSAERVEAAIDEVASRISGRLEKANPVVLLVMKGGMVFCGKLMERFSFPMELDYIHVSRYGTETFGAELQWMVTPGKSIQGRTVLVVDDILDEGQTLLEIVKACEGQGAKKVLSAVLVDKKHNRKYEPGFKADFIALEVEDRFVFGYGMDYKGYFRNVAGIYAIKASADEDAS